MALDKFPFAPKNVKITYTWSSREFEFESMEKQCPRTRIKAKKTYSFSVAGTNVREFIDFYNSQQGLLNPFLFTYDGVQELCYFSEAIAPKIYRECGKIVGFECDVSLEVDSQKASYSVPSESDQLPRPHGEFTYNSDWGTQVLEMGATQRRLKSPKAREKVTVNFSGTKDERDKIINLFNSHCRMPLILPMGNKTYKVRFPDSLTITDKREIKTIVGYETQLELEVLDGF